MTAHGHADIRRAGNGWLTAAGVLFLAFLAWRVFSLGLADQLAMAEPAEALAWRSQHPRALAALAEQRVAEPGQAAAAAMLARLALRADPLDGRPYRTLGRLAQAEGNLDRAADLFSFAVTRTPRDVRSQAWLASYHLGRGDAVAALAHIDVLLRVEPRRRTPLLPTLVALAGNPAAHDALAARLATAPPWRSWLTVHLSQKAPDVDRIAPLMERLRLSPGGLDAPEMAAWLSRLAREGRWGQAYLTWASQLPPDRQRSLGNVYNGGFEFEPGRGGFDWRFDRVGGARMDRMAGEGTNGQFALRVGFEDQRVPFRHVRQLMALSPGRYRLQGRARPEALRNERGLVWTVTCAVDGKPIGETAPLRGNGGWREFSAELQVPSEGCGGQWLTLRIPARIPAEQRIGGSAWFDDLKIVRIP